MSEHRLHHARCHRYRRRHHNHHGDHRDRVIVITIAVIINSIDGIIFVSIWLKLLLIRTLSTCIFARAFDYSRGLSELVMFHAKSGSG